jgi:hypothetical protein
MLISRVEPDENCMSFFDRLSLVAILSDRRSKEKKKRRKEEKKRSKTPEPMSGSVHDGKVTVTDFAI